MRTISQHNKSLFLAILLFSISRASARTTNLDTMPIRGFCIATPGPKALDDFVPFIQNELAPRRVNTLILRVDYRYQYQSHPELKDNGALSKEDVKKLVTVCRTNHI